MEKKIKIRKIIDDSFWDKFVSNSIHGTVFSTSAWLKALAAIQGGQPRMLGVWEGDNLIAGVSFIEIIRGSLKKANTHVLAPYGGFIYKSDPDQFQSDTESLQFLCAEKLINYLQQKYHYVVLVHTPAFMDIRPFSWQNWIESVRYTYLLEISNIDKQWGKLRERSRRKIRKAEKLLLLGGSITDEQIGDIYEKIFRDHGRAPTVPRKTVVLLIKNLRKSGLVEINTAREKSGEVISVQVLAHDKNTVYSWLYGTIPEKKYTGADSLLMWDAIKRYSGTRKNLDMVGANVPSIAFFKKGFGGTLTPYYVTERYSSSMARTAFNTYSKIKGFFSR